MLIRKQYGPSLLCLTKCNRLKFACYRPRVKLVIEDPAACS